jgi:cytoskeleton protein RodZ
MTERGATPAGATGSPAVPPGALLRAARERAGWSVECFAAEMFLTPARLRVLEADDHAGLGGAVFVRGYLRRAAAILGVSPQEFVGAYEACCDHARPADVKPGLTPGEPPPRVRPAWGGSVAALVLTGAVMGGAWWWMGDGTGDRDGELAPVALSSEASLEFSPMAEPQALAWEAPRETVPEFVPAPPRGSALGPALAPAPAETVAWLPAPGPAPVVLAGERSAAEPGITQDPGPAVPPPGTVELRFAFSQDCWLEVEDADQSRVTYRLYRSGEVARFRGKPPMTMFLGNADGVELTVDGAPVALRPAARRDGTARLTVGGGAG